MDPGLGRHIGDTFGFSLMPESEKNLVENSLVYVNLLVGATPKKIKHKKSLTNFYLQFLEQLLLYHKKEL